MEKGVIKEIVLYKKSTKGTPLVWKAVVNGKTVEYSYGQLGGKIQTKLNIYSSGKAGRTPEEQALLECQSTAKKKRDTGYASSLDEEGTVIPRPTLAFEYSKQKHKLNDKIFINPKLDGYRAVCDTHTGKLWSRNGKEFVGTPHINEAVLALKSKASKLGVRFIDGELYVHGLTFEELGHFVTQKKEPAEGYECVELHLFDCITDKPYKERLEYINKLAGGPIKIVSSDYIDKEDIEEYHEKFVEEGYEGSMLKNNSPTYEVNKRSYNVIKKKDFIDGEFKVVGFKKEKFTDTLGAFTMYDKEFDIEFDARPKVSREVRQYVWTHQKEFKNKMGTVRYQRRTADDTPLFPRLIRFRDEIDLPEEG